MTRLLASAIAIALAGTTAAHAAAHPAKTPTMAAADTTTTTQLPRTVRPSHYAIEVTPDAKAMAFSGKVAIDIEVLQATDSITLNQLDMTFANAKLVSASGKGAMTPKVSTDNDAQTATFTFDKPLAPGHYTLSTDYTGKIGTQATGLFALDYDTVAGKKRALYTQFENSDARRFIPSWDEPNYKATFDLTANVPSAQMVVSNMPSKSSAPAANGMKRVVFQRSPKMSTYLLFFSVGDFERSTTQVGDTQIGVVTQTGMGPQAKYALDSAARVLREYNDYFGVKYPLPKLDNIAAPGQSQFFSAMENWGSIFTFEYSMLFDPKVSTQPDKERIFSVEAHEMAHQWFGDLVTMRWWDDLWLNEGFASWMEGRTTAKLNPEWNTALDAVGVREGAMSRDALATTHPVVQHVETVEQASQAFDAITYSKGESVIRMLEAYKGSDAWRDGVRRYMKAHAYGNTVSDDLWKEMDVDGKRPLTQIAHDFTLQPGVPMLTVSNVKCAAGKTTLDLAQGQFSKDEPTKAPLRWHVPVIAHVVGQADSTTVVDGQGSMTLQGCGPVVVNAGQTGYYRTAYPADQMATLGNAFATIKPIDQLGLLGDAWALGLAGYAPASNALELATHVPADADPQVQANAVGLYSGIDSYLDGNPAQARFRAFALPKLRPMFAKLGWDDRPGDSASVKQLRRQLIGMLAGMDDKDVIAEARRRFAESDTKPMEAAVRRSVLGIVAYNADAATWDKLHAMAQAEKSAMVKAQLYQYLAAAKDDALAKRALDLALTDEPGATISASMIRGVAGAHPDMAFDFAIAHREQVDKLVDSTSRSRYYPGVGGGSHDPAMVGKIRAYAEKYIAPTSRRDAETAIAGIQYRVKVRNERIPAILEWLKSHGG